MADVTWLKLTTDIFRSRKFLLFETRKDKDSIELLWIKLLTLAAEINDGGKIYLTEGVPHTYETLASILFRPVSSVKTAIEVFEQYKMIYVENGIIYIKNWHKYQNVDELEKIREQTRKRVAKHRGKNQCNAECNVTGNVTVTLPVTLRNAPEKIRVDENRVLREEKGDVEDVTPDGVPAPLLPDEEKMNPIAGIGRGLVLLSDNQMGRLVEDLSVAEIDHYISVVADQLAKGKTYRKSHYQAIMDMAKQDRAV